MIRPWWEPPPDAVTHEVRVLCLCEDIEMCRTEIYVSDVRIALRELAAAKARIERMEQRTEG